jgi:hypothetical protein
MNVTYNAAVGIPASLVTEVKHWKLQLEWSRHAKDEAISDKYGVLAPEDYPREFTGHGWTLVEVEADKLGHAVKVVVRRVADEERSLVLVILRDGPFNGLVKTCWTNLNGDNHSTLDKTKFAKS